MIFERNNIISIYQKILERDGNYCARRCPANLVYGKAICIGRVSQDDNRLVLSTEDRTFVINSMKNPSSAIQNLPTNCPYFKK